MTLVVECGCKGIRQCPSCTVKNDKNELDGVEESFWAEKSFTVDDKTYVFCPSCQLAHRISCFQPPDYNYKIVEDICEAYLKRACVCRPDDVIRGSNDVMENSVAVAGTYVYVDFLDAVQENAILEQIEAYPWKVSQSGRLKQDFGPKPNFKKKKLRLETFTGLPPFSERLLPRLTSEVTELSSFTAVEQCHLDYDPCRGSHIDPHFDDFWLWGERLVTVNLLCHSIITLSHPHSNVKILVGQPRRSVVILRENARNEWLHGIYPNHIIGRRIAITYRELSNEILETEAGQKVLKIARCFTAQEPSS